MKLATYADGSRDGQLVVVSRDLTQAHHASHIAPHLRAVLDDWNFLSPQLEDLSTLLNQGKARHAFAFDPARCLAPLPRPAQWLRAWSSLWHWRRRQGDERLPPEQLGAPRLAQGASDQLRPAHDVVELAGLATGLDFEPGIAAITGDVRRACSPAEGLDAIRLLMLSGDWCWRDLEAQERAVGDGLRQSRPATHCGPVAVTPEEWGEAWQDGRLQAALVSQRGLAPAARTDCAAAMDFHLGQCVAVAARQRGLAAGTVLSSGPLCLPPPPAGPDTGHHAWADAWGGGGDAGTGDDAAALSAGDAVTVDLLDAQGRSPMGGLRVRVEPAPVED